MTIGLPLNQNLGITGYPSCTAFASPLDSLSAMVDIRGIDPESIQEHQLVCELRIVNNAVKHSGKVEGEIAEHPLWNNRKGEELGDLWPKFDRFQGSSLTYIESLAATLRDTEPT